MRRFQAQVLIILAALRLLARGDVACQTLQGLKICVTTECVLFLTNPTDKDCQVRCAELFGFGTGPFEEVTPGEECKAWF